MIGSTIVSKVFHQGSVILFKITNYNHKALKPLEIWQQEESGGPWTLEDRKNSAIEERNQARKLQSSINYNLILSVSHLSIFHTTEAC